MLGQDILGPLKLLWPQAKKAIHENPGSDIWLSNAKSQEDKWSIFHEANKLDPEDPRRLAVLEPDL